MHGGLVLNHKSLIEKNYGLIINSIEQMQGGWSALAYKIISEKGDFFLKAFDKRRHTAQVWINKIDEYIPIVMALSKNNRLCEKISAPILTVDGAYKVETSDRVFIVYPFIEGETPGNNKLFAYEQECLAEIIAELHSYTETDFSQLENKEDFDVSICENLSQVMTRECLPDVDLCNVFLQYKVCLQCGMTEMKRLATSLSAANLDFVLCHTDLHGWNLRQAGTLVLLDWEGLKLAPAEADLFAFSEGFFFDYACKNFFACYKKARPNYSVNQDALMFYRLRRRLEDILEFAKGILFDGLSEDERTTSMNHLTRECIALQMASGI